MRRRSKNCDKGAIYGEICLFDEPPNYLSEPFALSPSPAWNLSDNLSGKTTSSEEHLTI